MPWKVLLPKRAMSELVKLSADAGDEATVRIAEDDNHLFFEVGHRLLIARRLTGNFPDYARVLPSGDSHQALLDRAGLMSAIARVSEFSDERSQACRVQLRSGELRVFASCVETGESEEAVPCEYAGPDVEIGFNASYLMQFLNAATGARVALRVTSEKSAGELRPENLENGQEYRYVVMPMRI